MIYKKLNAAGTKWEVCEFDSTKKQIPLYDYDEQGFVVQTGIGLY